jgi:predicted GIY-YIG superfamily endonuclease
MAYSDKEKTEIVYIYIIKCPITKDVVYVGKANDLQKRINSHHNERYGYRKINKWINNCIINRLVPIFEVYKVTDKDNWCEEEIKAISYFREKYKLLNVAKGGNSFYDIKTCKENGKKVANSLHSDPKRKRLWYLKKELASFFKKNPNYHKIPYMRSELNKIGIYI